MISESDLAAPVVTWLSDQNWNVYQEVEFKGHGGVADIVAERLGILWIIECKTSYSFRVLEQASEWPAHYRSIAVPRSVTPRDYRVAVDYYRVGVIEVDCKSKPYSINYEARKAPVFSRHHKMAKYYLSQLTEAHKTYALAGSKSGHHLTPYKLTMMEIERILSRRPGITVKELYEEMGGPGHYANRSSFQGNVIKCLESFEEDWCLVDTSSKPYRLYLRDAKKAPSRKQGDFTLKDFIKSKEA